jgi:hypothetical protein
MGRFSGRAGNGSALERAIDQGQVSEDNRSRIRSDPNREDDEQYIVRLVGQVVRVSVETVKIVSALPAEYIDAVTQLEQQAQIMRSASPFPVKSRLAASPKYSGNQREYQHASYSRLGHQGLELFKRCS